MRLALALILLALVAPAAAAHDSPTSRVHDIRHVAVEIWGPGVCGDTMTTPIRRVALPDPLAGQALLGPCVAEVDDSRWNTRALCVVILHEFGHLAGWGPLPGEEYVGPDGSIDPLHGRNPHELMFPQMVASFPPCERVR